MKDQSDGFLQIDEFNLDQEWINQPRLYYKWAAKSADARQRSDEAKAELEVVKAELSLAIRSNPEKYGFAKVTEVVVAAAVLQQEECENALQNFHNARHDYDIAQVAVSALDQRCKALEKLVTLKMADYFSEPKAPREAKGAMGEKVKQSVRRRGRERRETT